MYLISKADRLPINWQNTRDCGKIAREGVTQVDNIDMQFSNQSLTGPIFIGRL